MILLFFGEHVGDVVLVRFLREIKWGFALIVVSAKVEWGNTVVLLFSRNVAELLVEISRWWLLRKMLLGWLWISHVNARRLDVVEIRHIIVFKLLTLSHFFFFLESKVLFKLIFGFVRRWHHLLLLGLELLLSLHLYYWSLHLLRWLLLLAWPKEIIKVIFLLFLRLQEVFKVVDSSFSLELIKLNLPWIRPSCKRTTLLCWWEHISLLLTRWLLLLKEIFKVILCASHWWKLRYGLHLHWLTYILGRRLWSLFILLEIFVEVVWSSIVVTW